MVIDDACEAVATYVEGRKVYDVHEDKGFFNQAFVEKYKAD